MSQNARAYLRRRLAGYAAGLASVALMGAVIGLLLPVLHVANLYMLYLVAVLAIAITFGRGPAILSSVAAFLSFNWFFIEPQHTFIIADPGEWIALLVFLVTAGVTGQLAATQRQRAEEAEQRQREAVVLYDVVRLMSEPALDSALRAVAERLRDELALGGVAIEIIEDTGVSKRVEAGDDRARLLFEHRSGTAIRLMGQDRQPSAEGRGAPGKWIRVVPPRTAGRGTARASGLLQVVPIRVQGRRAGELLLAPGPGYSRFGAADDRLLSAVATQLGLAVERAILQREATETEILRRTDDLKTALLNAVSHDLRTPLTSIITSAGSLRQRDVAWTGEEQQELAMTIEEEAKRLNQIVGNLLNLSRMEGGSLHPEMGWYDLGALIDDVAGRLRRLTEENRIAVDVPDDLPPVLLDYIEIDQVLSNLIENATKHTPPGTEISVSARNDGARIRVEVADRGPGIPAGVMPRLFDPFFTTGDYGPRPKGVGLGLAVARGLVEAHGGQLWAENQPEGGARFVFTLPLQQPEDPHLQEKGIHK